MDTKWQKVKKTFSAADSACWTIRFSKSSGICVSANFCKEHKIKNETYVHVFTCEKTQKLGIRFNVEKDEDAYKVGRDGGGAQKLKHLHSEFSNGFIVCSQAVESMPRLKRLAELKIKQLPVKEGKDFFYIVLRPCFELVGEPTGDDVGIYCLRRNSETVYIGQGKISERLKVHKSRGFEFDEVRYSITAEPKTHEAFWLEHHKEHNAGALPLYNKVNSYEPEQTS